MWCRACDTEPGCHLVLVAQAEQGCCRDSALRAEWSHPVLLDQLGSARAATEGTGRQVMYQADFWIVWHLSVRKPKWICRSQRKSHLPHYWAAFCSCCTSQLYSPTGIYCSFLIWCFNIQFPRLPVVVPVDSLSRAAALTCVPLPLPVGVRHLRGSVSLRSSFTCPPLLSAKREELLWKHSKGKCHHKVTRVLPFPQHSCEPDIKTLEQAWTGSGLFRRYQNLGRALYLCLSQVLCKTPCSKAK